jgi:hypothetical protein
MNQHLHRFLLSVTGASAAQQAEVVQTLWSGYGTITRYQLTGAEFKTVIVKQVVPPTDHRHPRGWNTSLSHQRKLRSYRVEAAWYENYSAHCHDRCRLPQCLGVELGDNEFFMVLEDLDASGFAARRQTASIEEMTLCLNWLANFHATFMGQSSEGLWPVGTYWHLDTRPEELAALEDAPLKAAAGRIDLILRQARYQTLVHGDAKLANFCFSEDGTQVAAVDFQYVGGGCGMKDVAYFIGSCLDEAGCERHETRLLEQYFSALKSALSERQSDIDPQAVEQEWRPLYPVAWTDFHRFVKGWSPGHWKIHDYSERMAAQVLAGISDAYT